MNKNLVFFLFLSPTIYVSSQPSNYNPVVTATPLLLVAENAQIMGMAQIGVVASTFNYHSAITQNPALLARNKQVAGIYFSHVPWMRTLVPDIDFLTGGGHYSKDGINAFSYTYTHFGMVNTFDEGYGDSYQTIRYARAFTEKFSAGIGFKHIRSKDHWPVENKYNAFAFDFGVDYRKVYSINEQKNLRLNAAASLLNIGNKITKNDVEYFLPANFLTGFMASYQVQLNNERAFNIDFAYQVQKLLVPTSPLLNEVTGEIISGRSSDVSVFNGMIQSFYDAPGGINEEMKEISQQIGTEFRYTVSDLQVFTVRAGGYYQNETKGNNKYLTTGVGYGLYGFTLNLAYLIPLKKRHPLAHTLCYTVGFKFNLAGENKFSFSN